MLPAPSPGSHDSDRHWSARAAPQPSADPLPARRHADGDDPGPPRLRPARRRQPRIGRIALRDLVLRWSRPSCCWSLVGLVWHGFVFWLLSNTVVLGLLRLGLMVLAVGWALPLRRRLAARPAAGAARRTTGARWSASTACSASPSPARCSSAPTWSACSATSSSRCSATATATGAHDGRYNVLLLGGDSGAGRWGLRPDSMTVASIDADTGKTVLIGLPRNMTNFPFAKGSVMAQAVPARLRLRATASSTACTWAGDHTRAVQGRRQPGRRRHHGGARGHHRAEDQLLGDGQPPGLPRPRRRRRRRHPQRPRSRSRSAASAPTSPATSSPASASSTASTRCGSPGPATSSDDYSRMARQKCVMNAMLHQISPQTVRHATSRRSPRPAPR